MYIVIIMSLVPNDLYYYLIIFNNDTVISVSCLRFVSFVVSSSVYYYIVCSCQ